jgi:hypothetical protein
MLREWRLISFAAVVVGCAPHHPTPATVPAASTERLKDTYACVVDAIADAGYRVSTNEKKLFARGSIVGQSTPVGAGAQDLQPGFGEKVQHPSDVGTGYSVDRVTAGVTVDPGSGRIVVLAGASSGVSVTRKSGYTERGPTARGMSAITQARACAQTGSTSN